MPAGATFEGPGGRDPVNTYKQFVDAVVIHPEDVARAGQWLTDKRRTATLQGIDVNGAAFAPYSSEYAYRKGMATSTPNLYSSPRQPLRATRIGSGFSSWLASRNPEHMVDALTFRMANEGGSMILEMGVFGDIDTAMRAKISNEGAEIRTVLGTGSEGFRNHPGRRRPARGKGILVIPQRFWIGASDKDLEYMAEIISESAAKRARLYQY